MINLFVTNTLLNRKKASYNWLITLFVKRSADITVTQSNLENY